MGPTITRTIAETRQAGAAARARNLTIGLVPTMGALHAGHAALIRAARAETGYVAVSIFLNPTQFGPNEDLSRYPHPFERDFALCAAEGVDLIFHPEPAIMYPPHYHTYVEVHALQDVMCGASRPGHFRGVVTVVLKLFNILQPDVAYFGQKDAQQVRLIQQMVTDLDVPLTVKVYPIVREPDGLALSSRNAYLNAEERKHATVLYQALEAVRRRVASGERGAMPLIQEGASMIARTPGARLDYFTVVDPHTLAPLEKLVGSVLIALAVYIGGTRLIDNLLIDVTD